MYSQSRTATTCPKKRKKTKAVRPPVSCSDLFRVRRSFVSVIVEGRLISMHPFVMCVFIRWSLEGVDHPCQRYSATRSNLRQQRMRRKKVCMCLSKKKAAFYGLKFKYAKNPLLLVNVVDTGTGRCGCTAVPGSQRKTLICLSRRSTHSAASDTRTSSSLWECVSIFRPIPWESL